MIEEHPTFNEAAIIARLRDGDESAFNELYREYYPVLSRQLSRILKNESDLEEIANETFLTSFRKIHLFRGDSSFKTWIIRIGMNKSFNRVAYNKRRGAWVSDSTEKELGADGFTLGDTLSDQNSDPRIEITENELERNVADALTRLAIKDRELIEMRGVQHLRYEEISAKLGINIGTVKSRLARSREKLRQALDETPKRAEVVPTPKPAVVIPVAPPLPPPPPIVIEIISPRRKRRAMKHYPRDGLFDAVILHLKAGLTNRAIKRCTGVHMSTLKVIRAELEAELGYTIKCGCGYPVGHPGWCTTRFAHSPQRMAWMAKWKRFRATQLQIAS